MMLLTCLGVSLGAFECFPQRGSYQTPNNLSSSSGQPPSPGSSDCKPQATHPMSFIHLHELLFPTSAKEVEEFWRCPDDSAASHRSQTWSTYLVTLWHCCEHLTTLSTSHTITDLLSTSSAPRAAKIPVQILLCHKAHPAWDHPIASRMQGNAFLTSVLVLPCPALSEESIRHW